MIEKSRDERAREIQSEIGRVLLEEWDPIGVAGVPEAADEYDSYVGRVYHQIKAGVQPSEMAAYLADLESRAFPGRTAAPVRHAVNRYLPQLERHRRRDR